MLFRVTTSAPEKEELLAELQIEKEEELLAELQIEKASFTVSPGGQHV